MNKRIRRALLRVVRALWAVVRWLFGSGVPLKKRPRTAFSRISFTTIGLIAATYFGDPYVDLWQLALLFTLVFIAMVCLPLGEDEEEIEEEEDTERPDEDYEVILTVKFTNIGPKGYFDDPLNPSYTHIVDLDKHIIDGSEFAA